MFFVCFVAISVCASMLGGAQADPSDAELEAASAGRSIRIGIAANGVRRPTEMLLEVYVASVLAGEGEPRAADAAQQALAIAIRTFAAANLGRHERDGYDLCDTTHCQVMRAASPATRRAALATAGQLLLHEGHAAEVFYSASCGGHSEAAGEVWAGASAYPYLRAVKDDVHEEDVPWMLELTAGDVLKALRRAGFEGSRLRDIDVDERNESGRVTRLGISGLRPSAIRGVDFRAALGANALKSTVFDVKKTARGYRFTGRGFGHGVGMCVIGAGRRAARGESAAAILQQYYPGLTLAPIEHKLTRHVIAPATAPTRAIPAASATIIARAVDGSGLDSTSIERLAQKAHAELEERLGTSVAPITIEMHASIDTFRQATGRPWWTSAVVTGTAIDLAPAAVLAQRDGVEVVIRRAVAEVLIGNTFAGRPAWMRVGSARYFAWPAGAAPSIPPRLPCPSDAELTLAVSAQAQREAESRAESCFARALARTRDWRAVR